MVAVLLLSPLYDFEVNILEGVVVEKRVHMNHDT